jgi:hypothetical protein
MQRRSAIFSVVVFTLVCLPEAVCFAQAQSQPSAAAQHSPHRPQGFFDYALGKINPNGNDYGASIEAGRDAVVEHTIDDLYFWSNVVTLLLLTGMTAVVFLQWRSADKKEVIAASLIAELWNGRVSDRIEVERRTEQFNQLVETHNAEVERAFSLKSQVSEQEKQTAENLSESVRRLTEKGASPNRKGTSAGAATVDRLLQTTPDASSASLQQSNLLLQRRIESMQNTEQNLKQRLNQTTLLLDQERRHNATLKGA